MDKHDYNTIIKFADDTTVVGLITNNDETEYRQYNLSLIVSNKKELIVDYRKGRAENAPIHIDGAVVKHSFNFIWVHITNKLSWSKHTKKVLKR